MDNNYANPKDMHELIRMTDPVGLAKAENNLRKYYEMRSVEGLHNYLGMGGDNGRRN